MVVQSGVGTLPGKDRTPLRQWPQRKATAATAAAFPAAAEAPLPPYRSSSGLRMAARRVRLTWV